MVYDGHDNTYTLKHDGKSLALAHLPLTEPYKAKARKGSEKSSHKSEIWEEYATSKSRPRITLPMVKPNTSEEVRPLPLVAYQELKDEILKKPIPLYTKIMLGESSNKVDQATSETSLEYDEFELFVVSMLRSSIS